MKRRTSEPSKFKEPKASPAAAPSPPAKKLKTIKKVRVWWPPTKNRSRSDVSGMFWPARLTAEVGKDKATVVYDNDDVENVLRENIQPAQCPVDFGKEDTPLQVGEFCEVFNGSKTDPAAWIARVKEAGKATYVVKYPFHDGPNDKKKAALVRRARICTPDGEWLFLNPNMKWKDCKYSSPMEAKLIGREALNKWMSKPKAAAAVKKEKKEKKEPKRKATKPAASKAAAAPKASTSAPSVPHAIPGWPHPHVQRFGMHAHNAKFPLPMGAEPPKRMLDASTSVPAPSKQSMAKRLKALGKPTKAKSAYLCFCDKHRPQAQRENPTWKMTEITKYLGDKWKKTGSKDRAPFQKLADKDAERYDREAKAFNERMQQMQMQRAVPAIPPVPAMPPTMMVPPPGVMRPPMPLLVTGFQVFAKETHEKMGDKCNEGVVVERWHKLSDKDKGKFEAKALKESEKIRSQAPRPMSPFQVQGPFPTPMPMPGNQQMVMHTPLMTPTQLMDMEAFKKQIKKVANEDAYYMVIDALRPESKNFQRDAQAAHTFYIDRTKPDVKGLLIALFGMEEFNKLKKK